VIGPNGAGKTTLFNLVGGKLPVSEGRILYRGQDITRRGEHRRARSGIAKTFQRSNVFGDLPVTDNVAIAVQRHAGRARNLFRHVVRFRDVAARTEELLGVTGLRDRSAMLAANLSHGERRQLEIALALALEPTLLLLDEPAAGMSTTERQRLSGLIRALPPEITVLLIEHDIDFVFELATHVSVMAAGALIADGEPDAIAASEEVREAYLGTVEAEEVFYA
jgi:branched-chain amino acid transport system ATP-binding protein